MNALHVAGPTLGIDAGGLIADVTDHNSWVATVGSVDPLEMLEVQLCNATAPFILFLIGYDLLLKPHRHGENML